MGIVFVPGSSGPLRLRPHVFEIRSVKTVGLLSKRVRKSIQEVETGINALPEIEINAIKLAGVNRD